MIRTRPSASTAWSALSAPTRVAVNQTSRPSGDQAMPLRLAHPSVRTRRWPPPSNTTMRPRSSPATGCSATATERPSREIRTAEGRKAVPSRRPIGYSIRAAAPSPARATARSSPDGAASAAVTPSSSAFAGPPASGARLRVFGSPTKSSSPGPVTARTRGPRCGRGRASSEAVLTTNPSTDRPSQPAV